MSNLWSNIWWIDMISDYSKPQLQTNHKLNVFLSRLFKIIFRWCLIGFSIVLLYKKHSDSTWHYSSRISNNHAHNSFCDIDCGPYGEFHFLNILSVFAKLFIPFKNIWFHFFYTKEKYWTKSDFCPNIIFLNKKKTFIRCAFPSLRTCLYGKSYLNMHLSFLKFNKFYTI